MRRFLIALMATVTLPAVAQAQDQSREDGRGQGRAARAEWRQNGGGQAGGFRQRPADAPAYTPRADRPQRVAPVDNSAQVQVSDGNRGNRGNWGGNGGGGWRGDRQAQPAAPAAQQPAAVPAPAVQPRQDGGRRDWNRGGNDGQRNWNGNAAPQRSWNGGTTGQRDWNRSNDGRRDWNRDQGRRDWDRNNDGRRDWDRGGNNWNGNRAGNRDFRNWDRGWRNNNRYNWQGYRSSNRYAYRLPRYYAPSGWGYGYRPYSIGAYLFAGLFSQNYWIDDPWQYRLPPAYWPYQWVRYYNDALLVDTRSGYVVDVIQDIFWY